MNRKLIILVCILLIQEVFGQITKGQKIYNAYRAIDEASILTKTVIDDINSISDSSSNYKTLKIYFRKINNPYSDFNKIKLSKKESVKWFYNLGCEENLIKKLLLTFEIDELNQLIFSLEDNAPNELKKIFVSDFYKYPDKIKIIINNLELLKAYARVIAISSEYRTDLDFLHKVSNYKNPIEINTIEKKSKKSTFESVKYKNFVIDIPFSSGVKIKGLFVDFKNNVIYEKLIPPENLFKPRIHLNNYAFMHFQEVLIRNKKLQSFFENDVLSELIDRKITSLNDSKSYLVPDYTWYYRIDGTIQLVKTSILIDTPHTVSRNLISGIVF